jgi:glycosyltransferase involved in cell wall biosynthesis
VRIAQVVTFISADGAFGGPVAVAIAQAVELAAQGHEVELLAGWDGVAQVVAPGVDVKLFHTRRVVPNGFSGLVAAEMYNYVRKQHRKYDVVHIQLARDLITLPIASLLARVGANYVVQSHGMIKPDSRLRARVFDFLAVRRVLRDAAAVISYRNVDDDALSAVSRGSATIRFLENGVTVDSNEPVRDDEAPFQVLFLARLHPRKRVIAFAEMAQILIHRDIDAVFSVVGPDEGELALLTEFITKGALGDKISYEGPIGYSNVRARLREASVYVLPSVNEPFPVTVLEAMAVGTPCVITDSCGIAPFFVDGAAGMVTDGDASEMANAVEKLILDKVFREHTVSNARDSVVSNFSITAVVNTLVTYYQAGMTTRSQTNI